MYRSLVFLRRTLHAALRREMGNIASQNVRGIAAIVGEDEKSLGIGAPDRTAIRSLARAGYEHPGSNKLLFESFLLRSDIPDMQDNQNKCRERSDTDSAKVVHERGWVAPRDITRKDRVLDLGNAAGEGCSFSILLFNFNQALHMHMVATVLNMRDNGRPYTFTVTGRRIQATARDAVQLLFSSGNIASGHVIAEGAR